MREPVETTTPLAHGPRRFLRTAVIGGMGRLGVKLERLTDTQAFVADDSQKLPEMLARFQPIPGMVPLRHGVFLYLLAYASSIRGDIVEVGSWQGRSTVFLAQACADTDNGVVHAIDPFTGNPGTESQYVVGAADLSDLGANFQRNVAAAGLSDRVVLHAKTSAEAHGEIEGPLRMVFIDGEHTYDAVREDLAYADLLAPGGVMVFDDYNPGYGAGVARAIQERLAQGGFTRPFQIDNKLIVRRQH